MTDKPEGWNGPPRDLAVPERSGDMEVDTGIDGAKCYCVQCGAVFVWADGRDCPTCTLAAELGLGDADGDVPPIGGDGYETLDEWLEGLSHGGKELSPDQRASLAFTFIRRIEELLGVDSE